MCDTFEDRYSQSTRYLKHRVSDSATLLEVGDESSEKKFVLKPAFWNSLLAGGIAGIVVDFTLYPLDTLKTRLQSDKGFRASGGFQKLYKGVIPVLLCSAPVSALFFCVYNSIINVIRTEKTSWDPLVYVIAASAAEVLCSTVRVPLEVLKQRKQTSNKHSFLIIQKAVKSEGFLGLYRGFSSTIAREVPFACIQFPLWEYMIEELIIYQNGQPLTPLQTAACGAIAGGIAGAATTPLDVIKTRIMLAEKEKIEQFKPRVYQNFAIEVFHDRGITGFLSGLTPRVVWIMLGGFIFFGTYEEVKLLCEQKWCFLKRKIQKFGKWLPGNIQSKMLKVWEPLACTDVDEAVVYAPSQENIPGNVEGASSPTYDCATESFDKQDPKTVSSALENTKETFLSQAPDPRVCQHETNETFPSEKPGPGSTSEKPGPGSTSEKPEPGTTSEKPEPGSTSEKPEPCSTSENSTNEISPFE